MARALPRAIGLLQLQSWFSLKHPAPREKRCRQQKGAVNGAARCGSTLMSSITADGLAAPAAGSVGGEVGPLEQKHLQNARYPAVAGSREITKTHWHIALPNALGWGFDGLDGVIFALVSPL